MTIDQLLEYAVKQNASDLHITVGTHPVIRVDGMLIKLEEFPRLMPPDTQQYVEAVADTKTLEKLELKGEVDFSYSIKSLGRFRVNIFKQRGSYSIVMRAVPLNVPTIEQLGLPPIVKELADLKRGLVLVTGPTGSGKSTTLASMINHINRTREEHVLTLEDPIEYLHRHDKSIVNQREMGLDSTSYADALRAALRQDPDVILIGEMRDLETISIAVTAAETGHLVLSTLHTTGAVSTVDRIIDVFPPSQQQQIRIQLAGVLQGVFSQQLLKRKSGQGRIAAIETMVANAAIRNHIREGKTHQIKSVIQTGRKQGMITMDTALMELFNKQLISREDTLNFAVDRTSMERYIR